MAFVQIGDLHMDEANGWESLPRLDAIVAELNAHFPSSVDFVFLPGDNANHGTPGQYEKITHALARLNLPWRVIPGDHDFELGDLAAYEAAFPAGCRPEVEVIAGHRCVFLDIVSAGAGGPDFRLTMHHRGRLARELARAEAEGQVPLVFMHAYPEDLAADGDEVAGLLAAARVPFVATGHTHYNELLNDGSVVYGATRSTGEIEEDDGKAGYTIVCVHDGVPSWRFRRTNELWPAVQIVAPCDIRLVTRPGDPRQVPRPSPIDVTARVFGVAPDVPNARLAEGAAVPMQPGPRGLWHARLHADAPGLHRLTVSCGKSDDEIAVLVRASDAVPKRRLPYALGRSCHAIGAWPRAGIAGTQLGPNRNGRGW